MKNQILALAMAGLMTSCGAMGAQPSGLTPEQAQTIALEHAGFTREQVSCLRAHRDTDDGVPHYEVQFRHNGWEYDYEIHSDTGQVISFDAED